MTDVATAACDGDARAAARVLVAMHHQQIEINDLAAEIARLAVDVSRGYSRGRWERYLKRTKVAPVTWRREWETLNDRAVPNLSYFQRGNGGWMWATCDFCGHRRPIAITPYVIRWGPGASSNKLRRALRCRCGHKGCSIQMPRWIDLTAGVQMWPENYAG
jgi:hypothetical protein